MPTSRVLLTSALLIGLSACAQVSKPDVAATRSSPTASPSLRSTPSPDVSGTAGRALARWTYQEGFQPTATSRELRVVVSWVGCASGAAPVDPQPIVKYSSKQVSVTVRAIPPAGNAFTCQGNLRTELTIPLTEPVGSRVVVPGPGRSR